MTKFILYWLSKGFFLGKGCPETTLKLVRTMRWVKWKLKNDENNLQSVYYKLGQLWSILVYSRYC